MAMLTIEEKDAIRLEKMNKFKTLAIKYPSNIDKTLLNTWVNLKLALGGDLLVENGGCFEYINVNLDNVAQVCIDLELVGFKILGNRINKKHKTNAKTAKGLEVFLREVLTTKPKMFKRL